MSQVGAASASTRRCPSVVPLPSSSNEVPTSAPENVCAGVGLDDDHLMSLGMTARRQQADSRYQLHLALVLDICRASEVDPFPDCVVVQRAGVSELACLDVDWHAREEAVATAVIEMQVGIADAGDIARDVLRVRRRGHIVDLRSHVDHAGVD